ncbi:MAG: mannosyltransferase, partial [Flavobacteriaceae bacterium]
MRALLRSLLPFFILCGFFFLSEQIERTDTLTLLICYSSLFLMVGYWIRNFNGLLSLFVLGILARSLFIFHLPELSQDFYRFLWDGQLQQLGINPYLKTPNSLVNLVGFPDKALLYEKMGQLSNGNYSNYPPASQLLFKIAALAHQTNLFQGVLVMRLFYFIGELIVFFAGVSFLKKLNLAPDLMGWYFLNPLVIIEGI